MRRLPVYLLLDCSESMIGESLTAVQAGVEMMLRTLRSDPHALETVWISCITFDQEARLAFPLSELTEVQAPRLVAKPGTALGAALHLCADRIETEVRKTTSMQNGDWRPLVILLTDGQPTDSWKSALPRLGQKVRPRPANIYAVGCGEDVNTEMLLELTDIVLHMREMTEERFRKLFVWLTASVNEGSRAIEDQVSAHNLEKLPAEITKVEAESSPAWDGRQKQVMLYAKCQKSKKPYLMRYRWCHDRSTYLAVCAHPLHPENQGGREGHSLPSVSSHELIGVPACPHCESKSAGRCDSCGGLFCVNQGSMAVCPHCGIQLGLREDGNFKISQSLA